MRRTRSPTIPTILLAISALVIVEAFQALQPPNLNAVGSRPYDQSKTVLKGTVAYLDGLTKQEQKQSQSSEQDSPCQNPRYPSYSFDKYLENPYFQKINTAYPGLQLIHEEPYIFLINNFLSADECSRLRAKADDGMLRPQIGGGSVDRTSSGVVCTRDEVPSIQQKMMELTSIHDIDQLQYLKVSKYKEGQTFSKHTDAWPTEGAPISRGWVEEEDFFGDNRRRTIGCLPALEQPNHNTLLTCFVYLNDVHEGGCTTFPNIGLHTGKNSLNFYTHPSPMDSRRRQDGSAWDWEHRSASEPLRVSPEEGMAVLHFCSLLPEHGGMTDGNAFHIAEPPAVGHEKYVSQQFFSSCKTWMLPEDSVPTGRVTWDTL